MVSKFTQNLVQGWEWIIVALACTVGMWFIAPVKVIELFYILTKLSWGVFFGELAYIRFAPKEEVDSVHTLYQKLGFIAAMVVALQLGL